MTARVKNLFLLAAVVFFAFFIFSSSFAESFLSILFPLQPDTVYTRAKLPALLGEHVLLVLISGVCASAFGIFTGIGVTRPGGRIYYPLARSISSMAQTFPPAAVLALAVPLIGYGFKPVITALFMYSIFPVISNTIAGMENVPPEIIEASRGMGMTDRQILFKIELPLAAKITWAGVRTSAVINIGTATIGAVAGAGGLGRIIIAGLIHDNMAFIFTGALSSAMLAFFVDRLFSAIDAWLFSARQ